MHAVSWGSINQLSSDSLSPVGVALAGDPAPMSPHSPPHAPAAAPTSFCAGPAGEGGGLRVVAGRPCVSGCASGVRPLLASPPRDGHQCEQTPQATHAQTDRRRRCRRYHRNRPTSSAKAVGHGRTPSVPRLFPAGDGEALSGIYPDDRRDLAAQAVVLLHVRVGQTLQDM